MGFVVGFFIVAASVCSAQAQEPIKIGFVYTFTGSMAFVNQNIMDGHNFAIDEINKAGGLLGREIVILKRDDAGKGDLATRYARELITREGVDLIIGGYGTIQANALAAVAEEFKTPTFIFGGHATSLTTEYWSPYHFRYAIQTTAEGKGLAKITAEEYLQGVKDPKIYYMSWDYEFGRDVARNFLPEIKKLVPNIKISEGWPRVGEMDYSPFISQILAYQPHVLINVIFAGGAVANLKQCAQMGVFEKTKLASACVFASNEYRKILGDAIPEGTWSWCYDDEAWPRNEEQKKFYDNFRTWKGLASEEVVPGHVWPSYNMIKLYAAAVEKAKTTDKETVCKAMEGIKIDTYNGPMWIRDFDHQVISGHIWGPMVKDPKSGKYILDPEKTRWVPIEPFLLTKEEWLAARKAAGK
ncbi:MAG: ABC transporter substrate-binding protein [Syntrophales bacterium]|jgi:branched-chain amino acid transport system substrate-binding protein|nr:ABC transporter substrate-binding protein [Syntrophales bacterium]MDY0044124.1 ABC transporter substrate-binding protein [Syntrophales bacterium]